VLVDGLTFPEAPRWRDGKLWFSDFYSHRVLTVDPAGRLETVVEVPQRPSGLGWQPDGTLLIVSMLDRRLLRLDGTRLVVDAAGGAYVGNFGFDRHRGEAERSTCLVRVDPDGGVTRVAEDLRFPNGTVITPDGRTLIVAETLAHRLTAFDVDAKGALARRRVLAALDDCYPDGICLDAQGAVWVADARSNRVIRVRADGAVDRTLTTGQRGAFACMLGGPDRRTLFVLTNTGSGPAMAEKTDGRIETYRVDVPGAGLP
jgi:sugar lactone lactonase YvrE